MAHLASYGFRLLLAVAILLPVSACFGGSTDLSPPNTVSFTFSGAQAGEFAASGRRPASHIDPRRRTWADAQVVQDGESMFAFVVANMVVDNTRSRWVQFTIPTVAEGTYPITGMLDSFFPSRVFNESEDTGYRFTQGSTVTVTSLAGGRIVGTFQGSVMTPEGEITISGGEFDSVWWATNVNP